MSLLLLQLIKKSGTSQCLFNEGVFTKVFGLESDEPKF